MSVASANPAKPHCALVLTGGGARAAYQVGVLKAIAEHYPRNHATPFSIICGTSAGAINATSLAVYASCFRLGVKKLEYIWRNFHCHHVFNSDLVSLAKQLSGIFGERFKADYSAHQSFALLDNRPLQQLLNRYLNYRRIDQNIGQQHLKALSVTCSNYNNGHSISFYQAAQQQQNWQRARRLGLRSQIHTQHLLASASIPMIFPPTQIGHEFYGDGSIHQLCPLSPAIHLGADKILTIQLGQQNHKQDPNLQVIPNAATVAGHLLDSIFSDTLNSDVERVERINKTLAHLTPSQQQNLKLKPIETLNIQANTDFEALSHEYYEQLPRSVRLMLYSLGIKQDSPSALTSFLMFEQDYTQHLIRQGYKDLQPQVDTVLNFLK